MLEVSILTQVFIIFSAMALGVLTYEYIKSQLNK